MSRKPPEPDDPMELVAMPLPPQEAPGALEEMARCFVEEFMDLGWNDHALLGMFRKPFYRGPHTVYRLKGEDYVRDLIAQVRRERQARGWPRAHHGQRGV